MARPWEADRLTEEVSLRTNCQSVVGLGLEFPVPVRHWVREGTALVMVAA